MRTTTLLDASSKAIGRIEETFGKQGERLRRDSSELNGTTPTLRFSKVYHRDKTGYLSSIATHRITTAGEEKREEAFTYKPYGEGVRLLTVQTLYDGTKNKLTETTYTYLGLRPESSITTTYPIRSTARRASSKSLDPTSASRELTPRTPIAHATSKRSGCVVTSTAVPFSEK